ERDLSHLEPVTPLRTGTAENSGYSPFVAEYICESSSETDSQGDRERERESSDESSSGSGSRSVTRSRSREGERERERSGHSGRSISTSYSCTSRTSGTSGTSSSSFTMGGRRVGDRYDRSSVPAGMTAQGMSHSMSVQERLEREEYLEAERERQRYGIVQCINMH
ncbi:hypothetical protein KIPB_014850, partial [Kipferlia bialata]